MNAVVLPRPDVAWRRALVTTGLLLAAVLLLYGQTGLAMVAIWSRSDTFAHGYLVPPIVVWLIWRQRHALAAQSPRPAPWLLLPLAAASAVWLIGDLAASNAVAQLAFTSLLVLVVVATIGPRVSRTIAFALGFLFFAVPVGEFVMPQMMQWTADFTVLALQMTGIPVYREGLQFVVPSGSWSVVEACSGIRYLIASIMVGTLFAYLNYASLRRRLIFAGVSVVVPIIANWIRAYLIVLIGHVSGNAAAVSADHLVYGWAFFGIVITLMFLIGARWSEPPSIGRSPRAASSDGWRTDGVAMSRIAFAAALVVLLPHLALRAMVAAERPEAPSLVPPTALSGSWILQAGKTPDWTPAFTGAAAQFNRFYVAADGQTVGLYVAYYRHQDYASKLVSSTNRVVTLHNPDWSAIESGARSIDVDGRRHLFETTLLRGAGHISRGTNRRLLVWKTYWIDGTLTANEGWAKVRIAVERLLGRGDDAAVVLMYRDVDGNSVDDAPLAEFVHSNIGSVTRMLAQTRGAAPVAVTVTP